MNAATIADTRRLAPKWLTRPWIAVLTAALLYAGFNAYWWGHAWDDMAITLGFARTLADAGMVAPTPLSDPVEGTSSLLWMVLNAAIYTLHGSPNVLFAQAKFLAIAFLLLDVAMVFAIAVTCGVSRPSALIVSLAFGGCYPAIMESVNGMENPLYLLLYCVCFLMYFKIQLKSRFAIFLIFSSSLLFIRWEAIWFLLPFTLIHVWRFGARGLLAVQHWIWLFLFSIQTFWRFVTFGDFVPNTIRAKTQPPYSPASPADIGDIVVRHLYDLRHEIAPVTPFIAITVGVFVLVCIYRVMRRRAAFPPVRQFFDTAPWPVRLAIAIVVAGAVFATVTAGNWGYHGRMFFIALPFLLVAVAWALERLAAATRIPARLAVYVIALAASVTVANGARGAYWHLRRDTITVAHMARVIPALESAKRLTGRSSLTVAHPDLGGLLLFGDGYRIVDTALLCNGPLARNGYGAFGREIFDRERPDVIQTHGIWTRVSRIAELERLYMDYAPVFLNGVRLFMRRDALAKIPGDRLQQRAFAPDGRTDDYSRDLLWTQHSRKADFEINRRFGYYFVPAE